MKRWEVHPTLGGSYIWSRCGITAALTEEVSRQWRRYTREMMAWKLKQPVYPALTKLGEDLIDE